jgi:hypothetical protein
MEKELTFRKGLNGNDFVENKKTYIFNLNGKEVCFRFGDNWNMDLFLRLCKFKLKKHFNIIA